MISCRQFFVFTYISTLLGLFLDHTFGIQLWVHTHTHTHLTALFSRTIWVSWHQKDKKVKPIWILLKQEKVSGSGISWAICKSAPRCRQITMPAPHHSVFYRPDALPAAQPTVSKHRRLALGPHAWIKLYTEGIHAE